MPCYERITTATGFLLLTVCVPNRYKIKTEMWHAAPDEHRSTASPNGKIPSY